MQENQVPNASIPPSNQPANTPEPKKSNTGLIIIIVVVVIASILQFFMPIIIMFIASTSFYDFIDEWEDEWEWSYEEDGGDISNRGSVDYKGDWSGEGLYLTLYENNSFSWSEMDNQGNSRYEYGNYVALSGTSALEHSNLTEEEAAKLFNREDDFALKDFYSIELLLNNKETPSRQILVYHINYYYISVYDVETSKTYNLSWTTPPTNPIEDDQTSNRT